jgi:hypothetical protein
MSSKRRSCTTNIFFHPNLPLSKSRHAKAVAAGLSLRCLTEWRCGSRFPRSEQDKFIGAAGGRSPISRRGPPAKYWGTGAPSVYGEDVIVPGPHSSDWLNRSARRARSWPRHASLVSWQTNPPHPTSTSVAQQFPYSAPPRSIHAVWCPVRWSSQGTGTARSPRCRSACVQPCQQHLRALTLFR